MYAKTSSLHLPEKFVQKLSEGHESDEPIDATVLYYTHQEILVEFAGGERLLVPGTVFSHQWTGEVKTGSTIRFSPTGQVVMVTASSTNEPS